MYIRMTIFLVLCITLVLPTPALSADATEYRQKLIDTTVSTGLPPSSIPVGTVIIWPSSSAIREPHKWLECVGQSTAGYPELAAVVGANVPNYQGMFLRGFGGQWHYKHNGHHIGYTYTYHGSDGLGIVQGDTIRHITGGTGNTPLIVGSKTIMSNGSGAIYASYHWGSSYSDASGPDVGVSWAFDAANVVPTANEIRPANIAVRYLIRARP